MTAFNPSTDLPSQINTVERLAAWAFLTLATVNPKASILEDVDRSEFIAQSGIIKAADGSERLIGRVSLELDPSFKSDNTKKLWMHANEVPGGAVIPAGFKSN
jgi:hypothetical protein